MSVRIQQRIRNSVVVGLVLATIYAAYASAVYLADYDAVATKHVAGLATVIASYYCAAILGGLAVGLCCRCGAGGWVR